MFEKLVSFTKSVSMLSDKPSMGAAELKNHFDAAPDEVRVFLNKLIDALSKTSAGDSGAKNIGATTINGINGADVQTILQNLKDYIDTKTGSGSWTGFAGYNGWSTYGGNYPVSQYRKKANGEVIARGAIKGGLIGANTQALLFPDGFRPPYDMIFTGIDNDNNAVPIYVRTNGAVCIGKGNNAFISLDQIRFFTS